MIQNCIILFLIHSISAQIVPLFRLSVQMSDDCWKLDTNNLTEISMGNCQNEIYYLNLGLGTPPLFSNFQIDTFRDMIWFPLNQTFVNNSQTFQITNKTDVTYVHKNIYEGSVGSDIVTVLQTNISTRSSVAWANKTMDLAIFPYIQGILGLGYSDKPNFLDNAAQNNQINSSIFALQMGSLGQPSVLYYSELPEFLSNANLYVPVVGSELWQVRVMNIRVEGFDYSNIVAKSMIIDTTTGLMYLNPSLYKKLMSRYFNSCIMDSNSKVICECGLDWPELEFILESVSITIGSDAYFQRKDDGCLLLIGETIDEQSPIMMGGSMMKNYIITFDKANKQVGFNGKSLGSWRYLFIIFQLMISTLAVIGLGIAIYLVMTVRYVKLDKLERRAKNKKTKQKGGKQKLLQLTAQFLDS